MGWFEKSPDYGMRGFWRWLIVVDLLTIQAPGAEDQGRGRETLESRLVLLTFFIHKLKPMAPVTCDTQAYFNILFPSISFFFTLFFLCCYKTFLLFHSQFSKCPELHGGWEGGMQAKCLMVSSKIANLLFGEANSLHLTIKTFSCSFYVTSNTLRQNLSSGWSDPFGTG